MIIKTIGRLFIVIGFVMLTLYHIEKSEEIFLNKKRIIKNNETELNALYSMLIIIGLCIYL